MAIYHFLRAALPFVLFAPHLSAQSVALSNSSNSALGMDFVSGDSFLLTITGAAANATVTLATSENGVPQSPYTVGTTDSSGNFSLTGTETDYYVAEYTEQYSVGGSNVGPLLDFEVIYKPESLGVNNVSLASPNCPGTSPYGILLDITYQLNNSGGQTVTTQTGIPMIPYEDVGS